MSNYWFIFIIFVPLGFAFGRNPIEIYNGNVLYFIIDFFGLSDLFFGSSTYTMNATWWFMSLIIILYVIYPVIYKIVKKNSLLMLSISLFLILMTFNLDRPSVCKYLLPMVLGTIFAKFNLFEMIANYCNNKSFVFTAISSLLLVAFVFLFRHIYFFENNVLDGIICIPVILFGYLVISKIKFIDKVFEQLGKYSGSIFMFHTFIFSYYFKNFIYSFKYSILIFLVLTVICYIVAVVLEWIKKFIRYDKLFVLITDKISNF